MDHTGVTFAMSINRVTNEQRWQKMPNLRDAPWDMSPKPASVQPPAVVETWASKAPELVTDRRRYVTMTDNEKYGPTDLCPGCISLVAYGSARHPHIEGCRSRIGEAIANDPVDRGGVEAGARKRYFGERSGHLGDRGRLRTGTYQLKFCLLGCG